MLTKNEIYDVSFRKVDENGGIHLTPAGRFAVIDGKVVHVADYHKLLERLIPEGTPDEFIAHRLKTLFNSPYLQIKPLVKGEEGLGDVPEAEIPPPLAEPKANPSVFQYHRVGMEKPHVIEIDGDLVLLDGKLLRPEEVATVLDNAKRGVASIRYHKPLQLGKMEEALEGLMKAAVSSAVESPRSSESLREHDLFRKEAPGIGSAAAFHQDSPQFQGGYHVSVGVNDLDSINKKYGKGVQVVSAIGSILRQAGDKTGLKDRLYRKSGDGFHAHFDTQDQALHFMREVRDGMKNVPLLATKLDSHKLSLSLGLGANLADSDKALLNAKKLKLTSPAGHTLMHSLVPGNEGAFYEDNWVNPAKFDQPKNVVSVVDPQKKP